ncbi:uncharacterized protein [Argopecten irradians]|uniref:uncharacterized protein isoform X3 n=1 Tax=Argopecten irradians TaxID=31199 RepID=UPI0037132069
MEIRYSSFTNNQGLFWLAFNASGKLTINCPQEDPKTHCDRESPITTPDSYMYVREIVGGTLGGIGFLVIIGVGLFKLYKCKKQKAANQSFNNQTDADEGSSDQTARSTTGMFFNNQTDDDTTAMSSVIQTSAIGPANTHIPRRLSPLGSTEESKRTNKRKRKKREKKTVEKEYQQHDTTPPETQW